MPSSRSRPARPAVVALAAVLWMGIVAVAASAQEEDWPMAGRDAAHGGVVPSGPPAPYRQAWEAEVSGGIRGGPVISGGIVVAVGGDAVAAFDAATGEERWAVPRTEGPAGSAAVAGELVVHASGQGRTAALVARDLDDGRERWRVPIGAAPLGGPAVEGTTIVVGLRTGEVLALDAETGQEEWRFRTDGRVESSPAVADGRVVAVSENFRDGTMTVHAIDLGTGERTWRWSPPGVAIGVSSPAIAGDIVVVGVGTGDVQALDAATGGERWSYRTLGAQFGGQVFGAGSVPAAGEGVVIADIAHVYRLDPATGEPVWSFRDDRWGSAAQHLLLETSPAVSGDTVIVGDGAGVVTGVDVASGTGVWVEDLGEGSVGPVAASEEVVVVALLGDRGGLVALEADPEGARTAIESATTLSPFRAVVNFALAFVLVGAVIVAMFRYLVPLALKGREAPEEGER